MKISVIFFLAFMFCGNIYSDDSLESLRQEIKNLQLATTQERKELPNEIAQLKTKLEKIEASNINSEFA